MPSIRRTPDRVKNGAWESFRARYECTRAASNALIHQISKFAEPAVFSYEEVVPSHVFGSARRDASVGLVCILLQRMFGGPR